MPARRTRRKSTRPPVSDAALPAATAVESTAGDVDALAEDLSWLIAGYAAAETLALRRAPYGAGAGGGGAMLDGELPFRFPGARPLCVALVRDHVRRRLRLVRRLLELEDFGSRVQGGDGAPPVGMGSDPTPGALICEVDRALTVWGQHRVASNAGRGVSTVVGAVGGVAPLLAVAGDVSPVVLLVVFSASVFVSLLIAGSFAGKRECFLDVIPRRPPRGGGSGAPGVYELESRVLGSLGVRRREFPLDLALLGCWHVETAVAAVVYFPSTTGVVLAVPGIAVAVACVVAAIARGRRPAAW